MTAFFADLSIIGIVAFCAWRGYKNGLIRGVFGIASLIAALIVANAAAQAYSKEANPVLMPFASGLIDSALNEIEDSGVSYPHIADDYDIDSPVFGTAFTVLRQIGLPEPAAAVLGRQTADETDGFERPGAIIDLLAEKLTSSLSYVAVFGIAFLLLAIVFAVIGNLLGFVFSLPGLRLLDVISGAVFGLAKGIIIVLTLAMIIRYFGIVALTTLENTRLLNYLVTNNIIADIFGL